MIQSIIAGLNRPPLHILDQESDAIAALALRIEHDQPDLAGQLFDEIGRAEIHQEDTLPAGTVTMGSFVEFIDEGSAVRRTVQLVYPQQADIEEGRISILTPVGAALIGLSQGDSILWPDRDGHARTLRIVSVRADAG